MELKIKSVKANAVLNIIYTLTSIIFPILTYPYVTRVLSTVGMGKVSFFTSVTNYAVMLGSLGIATYGIRAVAKCRDNAKTLSNVTSELLILNILITVVVATALLILSIFVEKFRSEPLLLVISVITVLITPLGLNWFYSGLEQYSFITKRTVLFKVISLFLIYICIREKADYIVYYGIIAFSNIGAYICNLLYSKKFFRFHIDKSFNYRQHIKPMLLLFASTLAINVYTNLDTIMLGFICGDKEVGLYSVACKIETVLVSTVNAVSVVLLPRLSNYLGNNETEKYNETLKKSISYIFLVTIPFAIYFILEAKDSIMLISGKDFNGSIICMQILMPIIVISGFSNVTGNQILIPQGKDSQYMKAVSIGAVVDLLLNAILMPKYHGAGASFATLIAEITQMSIQTYYSRKNIKFNYYKMMIVKIIGSSFLAGAFVIYVRRYFYLNSFVNLLITAIIYFSLYFILLIIMKERCALMVVNVILGKIRSKGNK